MQLLSYRDYFLSLILFLTGCNADLNPPLTDRNTIRNAEPDLLQVIIELQERSVVIHWRDTANRARKESCKVCTDEWMNQKISSIRMESSGKFIQAIVKSSENVKVELFNKLLTLLKKNGIDKIGLALNE